METGSIIGGSLKDSLTSEILYKLYSEDGSKVKPEFSIPLYVSYTESIVNLTRIRIWK